MGKKTFSKSDYTKGHQCTKMLWMEIHKKEEFDSSLLDLARLKKGNEVGDLAMGYYGDFIEVKNNFRYDSMAKRTADLLQESANIADGGGKPFSVCEATFVCDGMVCMADIVRPCGDMAVDLVEVKSSTKVKEYHVRDLAYQTALIERCGYDVRTASIMHVNSGYVLDGELDLSGLFTVVDLTAEAKALAAQVFDRAAELISYRSAEAEPEMPIGEHCNSPHPCAYQNWCWRNVPEGGVFDLAGMGRIKGFKHFSEGRVTFEHALEGMKLNQLQRAQALAETGRGDTVRPDKVSEFLGKLSYPLYFLDFETVQPAVPVYQGTRPWQQIPTQFSVHWIDEPHGKLHHAEFLADHVGDPRRALAEALCEAIPPGACTTAYNMAFEKGRIKELASSYPDLAGHLMDIHDGIVDLMVPFKNGWVYLKAMAGSYSIKKVLPALFPDDPELDYGRLEGVRNGSDAMDAFANLSRMGSVEEVAAVREQLLRYCELDTLAMVRLFERLQELAADVTELRLSA